MVYTEFVSAEALIRDVKSTQQKLNISNEERPVGIQIYGRDVEAMVEAGRPFSSMAFLYSLKCKILLMSLPFVYIFSVLRQSL